ncbi:MAG: substrate-binding domain-containing protein, partial [Cytophagaceae bacterium]
MKKIFYISICLLSTITLTQFITSCSKSQNVTIDGSSTVYPITEAVAEEFMKENKVKVQIAVSGTGGGFKKFIRNEIDMANASRPIKKGEDSACAAGGVEYFE